MRPLKTAQFAEVRIIGEQLTDEHETTGGIPVQDGEESNDIITQTIGIAVNLRLNENLGSTQKNIVGTPVPIFIPGYYQATLSAEKATLDLESWKTIANINPYTAFVPNTYDIEERGSDFSGTPFADSAELSQTENKVPRFIFGLYVYDRIQEEASRPTGMYMCMLQSYGTQLSANDAVIMEDVQFLARPVNGSWFSALKTTFNLNTFLGYSPRILPQRRTSGNATSAISDNSGFGNNNGQQLG